MWPESVAGWVLGVVLIAFLLLFIPYAYGQMRARHNDRTKK